MLTDQQLAGYEKEIARLIADGRVITVAGVSDVAAMLREIRENRLKLEKLAETCAELREQEHDDFGITHYLASLN